MKHSLSTFQENQEPRAAYGPGSQPQAGMYTAELVRDVQQWRQQNLTIRNEKFSVVLRELTPTFC